MRSSFHCLGHANYILKEIPHMVLGPIGWQNRIRHFNVKCWLQSYLLKPGYLVSFSRLSVPWLPIQNANASDRLSLVLILGQPTLANDHAVKYYIKSKVGTSQFGTST